jgi:hypothetical protein
VEIAVSAASKAAPEWRAFPAPKRGEVLLRADPVMRHRKEELGRLVTRERGKVIDGRERRHPLSAPPGALRMVRERLCFGPSVNLDLLGKAFLGFGKRDF